MQVRTDVLVVGGGPAGRALAAATAEHGLRTVLLESRPEAPWRNTYGSWTAELPGDLPAEVIASRSRGRAIALTEHELGWDYTVLSTAALRAHLDAALHRSGVDVRDAHVDGLLDRHTVELGHGTPMRARVVVDAGGAEQPLVRHRGRQPARAEQRAYGYLVDQALTTELVAAGEAVFMDWRPQHGEPGHPTFLYAVPMGDGRMLLEETSLAGRHGFPLPILQNRLRARLAVLGIDPQPSPDREVVRIVLDPPRHPLAHVLAFGAAAPLIHPATGFSLATSLTLAPVVARALATRMPDGADVAIAAARAVLWPATARAVHGFRRIGLEALLRMPPQRVPEFFETFFTLPPHRRWTYLTGRTDLAGAMATMGCLFARSGWPLRAHLVTPVLRGPAPAVSWSERVPAGPASRAERRLRPGSRGPAAAPGRPR
jgi:lycopene beta-cyclase